MEAGVIEGGRILFALCLGLSWMNSALHVLNTTSMPYSRGIGLPPNPWQRVAGLVLAGLVFLATLFAWAVRWQELWAGLMVLGCIVLIQLWERKGWRGDTVLRLGKYSPSGSALAGYTVATLVAPSLGLPIEQAGWEGACGVMASAWFVSGWKKWSRSGMRWLSTQNTGLLVAERTYLGPRPLRDARRWLVTKPWLLGMMGVLGLLLEIAGIAFCIPDLRWAYAITVVALLGFTLLFLGYFEPEWALVMIALAWVT